MDMNERKLQILQAIIMNYLETAEPVGSRTISKKFVTEFSSATIRNEMSDLEEMGLIVQPHTSAGRIPTSSGYRLYVDQIMKKDQVSGQEKDVLRSMLKEKTMQLDSLLKEIGDILAAMTKYTSVVTMPQLRRVELKHVQLVPLDQKSAVMILVVDGNIVRNHIIPLAGPVSDRKLYEVSDVLNKELCGRAIDDINLPLIQKIKKECGLDSDTMESLLNAINDTLQHSADTDVFTAGTTNILNFPEFSDIARARSLMEFFEQKDQVLHMIRLEDEDDDSKTGLKIRIGTENTIEQLHDCSIVTANYRYNDSSVGSISVVGPMRMNYNMVVSALENLMRDFPDLFKEAPEDSEDDSKDDSVDQDDS